MARYIDADELKESLKVLKAEGNNEKYVQGLQDAIDCYFPQIIDDVPTADVEPVRHGRWIEHPDDIFPLESTIECSVCGEQENVDIHNDNFCPNCGAKMDGGVNDEQI